MYVSYLCKQKNNFVGNSYYILMIYRKAVWKFFRHKVIKHNNVVNIYLLSHYYKGTQIDFAYTDQTFCAKLFLKTT